ncbi:MAG: iron-only hydrogenase system regulator [Clostridia bacterium]|nr:iron-only hydrogenase system regulator [Clostridia bacterium]
MKIKNTQQPLAESAHRICVLTVIVEDRSQAAKVNALLSDYGEYVVGRMGIPYREKGVSVLSVVLDAPPAAVNALTGKLGCLPNVAAKSLFSKI